MGTVYSRERCNNDFQQPKRDQIQSRKRTDAVHFKISNERILITNPNS